MGKCKSKRPGKILLSGLLLAIAVGAVTGCALWEQNKAKIGEAILGYVENDGKAKAIEYIDQLVADGKLGAANAESLKAALDQGVTKLKEELAKEGIE